MSAPSHTAVADPADAVVHCYHCGHAIHGEPGAYAEIEGARQPMCCGGCKAVAEAIVAEGLDDYYRQRERVESRRRQAYFCRPG